MLQPSVLIIRKQESSETFRQPHQPSAGWMGQLIVCGCGHGIGRHAARRCAGDIRGACDCTLSPDAVLEAATISVSE